MRYECLPGAGTKCQQGINGIGGSLAYKYFQIYSSGFEEHIVWGNTAWGNGNCAPLK